MVDQTQKFSVSRIALLLPQNDLESKTIATVANKIGFTDIRISDQKWGARLEHEPDQNVGDLEGKDELWVVEIPGPDVEERIIKSGKKVVIIDHHNYGDLDRSHRLSSLEQFAKKCNYELTPYEKLVAVNDRAYIWGLIDEVGAEFCQIADVRRRDFEAQGYTEKDFKECEDEYESAKEKIDHFCAGNGLVIFHETALEKSGYFMDLVHMPDPEAYDKYCRCKNIYRRKNLLTFNCSATKEMSIIGFSGMSSYKSYFKTIFEPFSAKCWSGGKDPYCFIGFELKREMSDESIRRICNMITENINKLNSGQLLDAPIEKFTSFFILPFAFNDETHPSESKQWKLKNFDIPVQPKQLTSRWDLQQNYAEYIYFHDYVRSFLFHIAPDEDKKDVVKYYEFQMGNNLPIAKIDYCYEDEDASVSVLINGISAHIYPGNIGLLVIETSNTPDNDKKSSLTQAIDPNAANIIKTGGELLIFNNIFRRIYPSYFEKAEFDQQIKGTEFPKYIEIKALGYKQRSLYENVHFIKSEENKKLYPIDLNHFTTDLINRLLAKNSKNGSLNFSPIIDDRMFVYSYVSFPKFVQEKVTLRNRDIYFSQLLFVDNPDPGYRYDETFIKNVIHEHTYKRWENYQTINGFTRYSAAYLNYGHCSMLYRPFVSMYYQMFLLTVFYRARLIRFSAYSAKLSKKFMDEHQNKLSVENKKEFRDLHTAFMHFMNKLWFVEISNQDQGIENFKLLRNVFELEPMYNQVKDEIERADELVELLHNEAVEKFNSQVGKIGVLIGLLAIFVGFSGSNYKYRIFETPMSASVFFSMVLLGVIWVFLLLFIKNKMKWYCSMGCIVITLFLVCMIALNLLPFLSPIF